MNRQESSNSSVAPTQQSNGAGTEADKSYFAPPPAVSLPKGGGAIKGIGEKFAANPVTGTGSMSVPIATSPGRSGFGPQLSLSYDSGAGNGIFGLGWTLSLPSITRKTDKRLPRYWDAEKAKDPILGILLLGTYSIDLAVTCCNRGVVKLWLKTIDILMVLPYTHFLLPNSQSALIPIC